MPRTRGCPPVIVVGCRATTTTQPLLPFFLPRHHIQRRTPRTLRPSSARPPTAATPRNSALTPRCTRRVGTGPMQRERSGGGRPRCRHSLFSCNVGSHSPFKNSAPLGSALLRGHLTPLKCARKDDARSSFTTSASTCILALG